MTPKPPVAERRPHRITQHGELRADDYAWLKAANWQEVMQRPEALDGAIRAHLEAENAYAASVLAPTEGLQATLFEEMKARIKQDDSTVPAPDGPYRYFARYETGGEHPLYCRIGPEGREEVLLDGNAEAAGLSFYRIAAFRHAPDHRRVAYAVDLNGSEYMRIRLRALDTGAVTETGIETAQGDIAWAADGRSFFYTVLNDKHRPCRVMLHVLGDDPSADAVVYEEPDPGFFLGVSLTESRRFVVIDSHDHTTSEVRVIPADAPTAAPRLIAARESGVEYTLAEDGERFVILTNADGAIDFKIVTAPLDSPGRRNWRDLVPHEEGRLIRRHLLFAGHMARLERRDALPRLVVTRLSDGAEHAIAFDEEAYDLALLPGYEFDTTTLRFAYSSPTTPEQTFDYDMETRARVLRKTQEVPSGHDPADYVCRRLYATGHDGARIPITLLYRAGAALDGAAPVLLYGYGAYGLTMPAGFNTNRLSLVDRGVIYAVAHIRGGTECGYRWYLDGKLEKKPNTFRDFIAAAEHLVAAGLARPGRIAAHGGSAGGLLVGAVANMRPDLFGAIVGEVPFVDVLNTMSDEHLPLTPPEWPEWGNPIADAEAYRVIRSYSPYDNVAAQAYPPILALAGLTDPRVTYWEPAKWVAKLRATKTDDNPVLLRTNMEAGHAGASGRFDRLKEVALVYAFVLMVFGLA